MNNAPNFLRGLEFVVVFFDKIALIVGAWLVVAIGVLVAADVLGRTLFAHSISGTAELARNTVVLIVFCQVPASISEGKMLRVVAIFSRFSTKWQIIIEAIAALIAMAIFSALILSAVHPMISAFRFGEADGLGILKVPMGPVRAAVILLWALAFMSSFLVLARCAYGRSIPSAIVVLE